MTQLFAGRNYTIVDMQGFKSNNNGFIVREFCFSHGSLFRNFQVKQPFGLNILKEFFRRQVKWLNRNHHGLNWSTTDGESFRNVLKYFIDQHKNNDYNMFIVKGEEKKKWLEYFIKKNKILVNYDVINIEDFGLSNMRILYNQYSVREQCAYHSQLSHLPMKICALSNAFVIDEFIHQKNYESNLVNI